MPRKWSVWLILVLFTSLLPAQDRALIPDSHELLLPLVVLAFADEDRILSTDLTFFNLSSTPLVSSLAVFSQDGRSAQASFSCGPLWLDNGATFDLAPRGIRTCRTRLDRAASDVNFFQGWASLRWSGSDRLEAHAEIRLRAEIASDSTVANDAQEVFSSALVGAVPPSFGFAAPVFITRNRHSAFSLVNPSPHQRAHLEVRLLDGEGNLVMLEGPDGQTRPAVNQITVGPRQSKRLFALDLLTVCNDTLSASCLPPPDLNSLSLRGSLRLRSDIPVGLGGLDILFPQAQFVEIPVSVLDQDRNE
ncbi:MAG: hypothetical protein V3T83_15250 [Acidobacteriota bacterium]